MPRIATRPFRDFCPRARTTRPFERSHCPKIPATTARRAASAVEFAIVAPLLFMLVLGMIEFGRMLMVQQIVTNAAREGARKAVLPGATETQVNQVIDTYVNNSGIKGHTRTVTPAPTVASPNSPITVTVSVAYEKVSWLPLGAVKWLGDKKLSATVGMRKEDY